MTVAESMTFMKQHLAARDLARQEVTAVHVHSPQVSLELQGGVMAGEATFSTAVVGVEVGAIEVERAKQGTGSGGHLNLSSTST